MKIIIFGSTGMLGNYVKLYLSKYYNILCIDRKDFDIETCHWEKLEEIIEFKIEQCDIIINCAGAIPQQNCITKKYIILNTLFPHKLNEICKKVKIKFIHITTDCVFSGKDGNYNENSIHDSEDNYGITKSLGEENSMCILRTSIIGEEINNKNSLIEWVKKQKNCNIDGYKNVLWNGITCLQLAKIIKIIIEKRIYWEGVRHIFSPNIISKYELCCYINDIYNLNININIKDLPYKNMAITSIYKNELNDNILNIKEQIKEQFNYNIYYK